MVIPKMPRVNTIGIRFTKGTKTPANLKKALHEKLGIPVEQLAGLADYGPKRQLVKLSTSQMFDHVVWSNFGIMVLFNKADIKQPRQMFDHVV